MFSGALRIIPRFFLLVLETVLNDEFYSELFNAEDRAAVNLFKILDGMYAYAD